MSFMKDMIKKLDNPYAGIADDGVLTGDVNDFLDTGSYVLNALISGNITKGIPYGKVTAFAGKESVGKTFFALNIVKSFLDKHANGFVMYIESESAISKQMLVERGIDAKRVFVNPVETVEDFRTHVLQVLENYLAVKKQDRIPFLIILDSLGNLSTSKEMADSTEGKTTKDMTRAALIKSAFRTITLRLGKANIPMVITNHTYESMGMFSTTEQSGGSGIKYCASTIVFLSSKKEKDGTEVVGNIIHCKTKKSRFTKPDITVDTLLRYDRGLNKFYGLIEMGLDTGFFQKLGTKIVWPISFVQNVATDKDAIKLIEKSGIVVEKLSSMDVKTHEVEFYTKNAKTKKIELCATWNEKTKELKFIKLMTINTIYKNAEKYFTEEILQKLDQEAATRFCYGSTTGNSIEFSIDDEDLEEVFPKEANDNDME